MSTIQLYILASRSINSPSKKKLWLIYNVRTALFDTVCVCACVCVHACVSVCERGGYWLQV